MLEGAIGEEYAMPTMSFAEAIDDALAQAARLERHLAEERLQKKSKRANGLLLVHTTQVAAAQGAVEPLLDDRTVRWRLAEVVEVPTGGAVMEYLVRVDEPEVAGGILDRLREEDGPVGAAEFRSLKGLKARE